MVIWIDDFPLGPSSNTLFKAARARKGGFVTTDDYRIFKRSLHSWIMRNHRTLNVISAKLKCAIDEGFVLRVDCFHCFDEKRVFTKDKNKKIKQLDASNRQKAAHDGLAEALRIDDRYFFAGIAEKVTAKRKLDECTIFRISLQSPRSLDDLKNLMKLETQINQTKTNQETSLSELESTTPSTSAKT